MLGLREKKKTQIMDSFIFSPHNKTPFFAALAQCVCDKKKEIASPPVRVRGVAAMKMVFAAGARI